MLFRSLTRKKQNFLHYSLVVCLTCFMEITTLLFSCNFLFEDFIIVLHHVLIPFSPLFSYLLLFSLLISPFLLSSPLFSSHLPFSLLLSPLLLSSPPYSCLLISSHFFFSSQCTSLLAYGINAMWLPTVSYRYIEIA